MDTVIGWDAEEAFAERMIDAARIASLPELPALQSLIGAGEFGLVVAGAIRAGAPVTEEDVRLAERAFPISTSAHVAKFIREAVEHARLAA